MRKFWIVFVALISLVGTSLSAQAPAPATQVFQTARIQASRQEKLIFLVFGASWCPPCHQLDAFWAAKETRPIVQKYFVVAKLNVEEEAGKHPELNSPGGVELMAQFGGMNAAGKSGGVPFLVFTNANGESIVNSNRPVAGKPRGENIGYPARPEEIDWFMEMLKKALPSMTQGESRTVENWLRKQSSN
jgi:thioredoxin-related protein